MNLPPSYNLIRETIIIKILVEFLLSMENLVICRLKLEVVLGAFKRKNDSKIESLMTRVTKQIL